MNQLILLDTGPLGMVTNPKANPDCQACKQWLSRLEPNGDRKVMTRSSLPLTSDISADLP